jgi:IclR family transcriptional regulator, KDG regulon repressor
MIQVIHRALNILEYVAKDGNKPKPMGQIAQDLALNTATCANIIKTLVDRGYLEKSDLQKGYILGPQLKEITGNRQHHVKLIAAARIQMDHISEQLNEKCLLAVLKGDKRQVIYKNNCSQMVQATTPDEKKAYDSSTGRLLVALMSDEALEKFVHNYGLPSSAIWSDADTSAKFMAQIHQIRKNRYALIEDSKQVIGIASPIYQNGELTASLSIYLPAFRFSNTVRKQMIQLCLNGADEISAQLS